MRVLSIDPGYTHLGCLYALADWRTGDVQVNHTELMNLHHVDAGRTIALKLLSLIRTHPFFDECDVLLIERQPPGGVGAVVENCLAIIYHHKTTLVNPTSMQGHYNMRGLSRTDRKAFSVAFAREAGVPLPTEERAHDIADAYLILRYWMHLQKRTVSKYFPSNPT